MINTPNRMILVALTLLLTVVIWSPCAVASEESEHIMGVRQAIIDEGAGWTAGVTTVSGLTEAERGRLTLQGEIPAPRGTIMSHPSKARLQHESRYDCRDAGLVTSVKHQGSCGSCWAFSATGVVESAFLNYAEKELDLSEQHLVSDCCNAGGCGGGWPDWALDYIKNTGVPDEACYPYVARDGSCDPCAGWEDRAYKIKDHVYVKPSTDNFKWALKEYGPISVVLSVPDDWYYYRSGVYTPIIDVGWANHAVLLTGWDDSDGCWFIKNSWGTGWGEQGYARVKYGDLEKYNYAYAVTGIVDHGASPDPDGWTKPVSAVASSEYNENYRATRAIDNIAGTHWFSERNEGNPHITFDLGKLTTINKTRVMIHPRYVPLLIDIDVSADGITWRTVAEDYLIDAADYVTVPIASSRCQYVRMRQDDAKHHGTCTEFDVFCVWDAIPMPTKTTITIAYADGTNTIMIEENVISIMLSQNGTKVLEWWTPTQPVDG